MRRFAVIASAVLGLALCAFPIHADPVASWVDAQIVIDQEYDPQPITQKSAVSVVVPGQTFIPVLDGIDFADFILNNFAGMPGQVSAQLRDGVGGPILGVSDMVDVPGDNTFEYYRFQFPSRISLTPGETYALEMVQAGGGTVWICHRLEDGYAAGSAYWASGGVPAGWNFDHNFREGIVVVPEPTALALFGLGALAWLGAHVNSPKSLRPRRRPSSSCSTQKPRARNEHGGQGQCR